MTSGDEHIDFGRVDVLRVTVAVGPTLDTTPDEVFVLDLDDPHAEGSRWEETPYVDALEAMLRRVGTPPPPHAIEVTRLHATLGAASVERARPLEAPSLFETALRASSP